MKTRNAEVFLWIARFFYCMLSNFTNFIVCPVRLGFPLEKG